MTDTTAVEDLLVLVIASLIPALIYLAWIRGTERYATENWGTLLSGFAYGAIFATIVAAILELVIVAGGTAFSQRYPAPEFTFLNGNSTTGAFFLVLVIAPFVEEALKASGVVRLGDALRIVADGPVFGASVGLGFGFFETFLYGLGAFLVGGLVAGLVLIIVRSISSVLLHGSTTAMFGFGYAKSRLLGSTGSSGGYYLLAVLMHSSFNALASLSAILVVFGISPGIANDASVIALLAAIAFAFGAIEHARTLIHQYDVPLSSMVQIQRRPVAGTPRRR